MDIVYRIKYLARRNLLRVFGPAELHPDDDPAKQLERERDEKLGPRKTKETTRPPRKRHFTDTSTD